mmetsp:Transcript_29492/g.43558  ORF Transcript_29492/g.43558 Transcript_29492/m.43558 type:complete len:280 (-) Transcript_29492:1760-2599(-)
MSYRKRNALSKERSGKSLASEISETSAVSAATLSSVESAATVFHSDLTRESMDFDRRQIRREIESKIRARGEDPEVEIVDDQEWDDAETIYEDQEYFPWKQREAAVQAAAIGGKTDGRVEGYDSLERAIQAHEHQLIYGRGRGFGWAAQKNSNSTLVSSILEKQKLKSMTFLSTWASLKNMDESDEVSVVSKGEKTATLNPEEQDKVDARKNSQYRRVRDILYLLIAIGSFLGFAFYLETVKAGNYDLYVPETDKVIENQGASRDRTLRKQNEYPAQFP